MSSREYHHEYYLKNKERLQPIRKRYAEKHRADSVKRVQDYVSRNKEKVKAYNQFFGQSIRGRYRLLKHRHQKRGWTDQFLSFDEYQNLFDISCIYCGDPNRGGLDRVDNSLGYSAANSKPCCLMCNYMKKNHSVSKFIAHVRKINRFNPD